MQEGNSMYNYLKQFAHVCKKRFRITFNIFEVWTICSTTNSIVT